MKKVLVSLLLVLVGAISSTAAVIDYSDVGGYSTFQDTNTGLVWLDMDNFFDSTATIGTSGYDMILGATGAGFTFATRTDVETLLGGLPLTNGEWSTYASVMGYGIPRNLIWGMFDDGDGNPYGWAWAYSTDTTWSYATQATDANSVQNSSNPGSVDMGVWAFRDMGQQAPAPVPEPSTWLLLGTGLAGLAYYRRKKS